MDTRWDKLKFIQDQLSQTTNDPNLTIKCDFIIDWAMFSVDTDFVEEAKKVEVYPRSMVIRSKNG